eukprot:TRINITY_DN3057_c0_g1_i2.p2 TRINITY_DN3057_c0_g1~~TRINITY_DN3057_c0_g1_i2.p2  ORF type:complete len:180 (+),score=22.29 TRINITY_DN3057_c0_g1_i2:261-800(+)
MPNSRTKNCATRMRPLLHASRNTPKFFCATAATKRLEGVVAKLLYSEVELCRNPPDYVVVFTLQYVVISRIRVIEVEPFTEVLYRCQAAAVAAHSQVVRVSHIVRSDAEAVDEPRDISSIPEAAAGLKPPEIPCACIIACEAEVVSDPPHRRWVNVISCVEQRLVIDCASVLGVQRAEP